MDPIKLFSWFHDPLKWSVGVPSGDYLATQYCAKHDSIRGFLDKEMKKVICDFLAIDGNTRVPKKKESRFQGKKTYYSLITGTNKIGQAPFQTLDVSDSHY